MTNLSNFAMMGRVNIFGNDVMRSPTLKIIGVFLGSLFLFTWGLSDQEVISFDSRFYVFALEMWRHGLSWFPTTYHQPYPDYPALSTIFIYFAACLTGGLNKLSAVMPSAIAASLTVVMTYSLGESERRYFGWYAACLLMMTTGFISSARAISLDMYITCLTTACFYVLYTADKLRQPKLSRWIFVFIVLGFALRGPIGLVIPTAVVVIYYLIQRKYKKCLITGFTALWLLLLCSLALFALAYHTGGQGFVQDVLRMEFAGRLDNYYLPPYYYLISGLANDAIVFPLAMMSMLGILYYAIKSPARARVPVFLFQLIGWMLIVLIGMSIPGDKKIRYILPILPAAALLAAYPLIAAGNQRYFSWLRLMMRLFFLFLPSILLIGFGVSVSLIKQPVWLHEVKWIPVVMTLLILQGINFIDWLKYHRDPWLILIAMLSFFVGYLFVYEPIQQSVNRAADFVHRIESKRMLAQAKLVFYLEKPDGLPIKYLLNMPVETEPQFIETPAALMAQSGDAFIIMRASVFAALPADIIRQLNVIDADVFAHVNLVVVKKRK